MSPIAEASNHRPQVRPLPALAVFADVQNIYYTVRQAYKRHFNYSALWSDLSAEGEIIAAFTYAIDKGDKQQRQFQKILRSIGFKVKLKPFIQRADGSAKGDWDVGITLDVVDQVCAEQARTGQERADLVKQTDRVVLISGDGDFDLLLNTIRTKVNTYSIVYGVPSLTADSLIEAASEFRPIEGHLLLK